MKTRLSQIVGIILFVFSIVYVLLSARIWKQMNYFSRDTYKFKQGSPSVKSSSTDSSNTHPIDTTTSTTTDDGTVYESDQPNITDPYDSSTYIPQDPTPTPISDSTYNTPPPNTIPHDPTPTYTVPSPIYTDPDYSDGSTSTGDTDDYNYPIDSYDPSGIIYYPHLNTTSNIPNTTVTPTSPVHIPTGSDTSNQGGVDYSANRLGDVDEATINCLKKRLTSTEYARLRIIEPKTEEEKVIHERIRQKAEICFTSYQEVRKIEEASRHIGKVSMEIYDCMVSSIGNEALNEIHSGDRDPTELERRRVRSCFSQGDIPRIYYQTADQQISEDTENCLILALGEENYNQIKQGSLRMDLEDRNKALRCFGASAGPFQEQPVFEVPPEIKSCVSSAIGEDRLKLIKEASEEPTEQDRQMVKECFSSLNQIQTTVLPAPPDIIPFLEKNPEAVSINNIEHRKVPVKPQLQDRRLFLSGNGLPNSIVDIYIFSNPIVVTTKTDANGDWVYELNYPLDEGNHIAYVTLRDNTNRLVRSEFFDFRVYAAEETTDTTFLQESKAEKVSSEFMKQVLLLVAFGVIIVSGGAVMFFKLKAGKNENKDKTDSVVDTQDNPDTHEST